ncbi:MAG TPA: hypothetical protein VEL82_00020 [Thermoplasmata archaeon]|nr:hypothetical protein [Thermoplasmata archaeon]
MATCPACGVETGEGGDCPRCHLASALFPAVVEAAGSAGESDPTYLRTIGELLSTVALERPATPVAEPARGLLSPPSGSAPIGELPAPTGAMRSPPPIEAMIDLPAAPADTDQLPELKRRIDEYFRLGRRLALDFTDFQSRAASAALVQDLDSLEILAREMFVHLSSAIAEEYESLLARRNEIAQLVPTPGADVGLTSVRRAIGVGDLPGAQRRLALVRDELSKLQEQWEVGRVLVAEGELMAATIIDLGGDPSPATGPLEEGRKLFADGRRPDAERVLARGAVALWTVLEPLLMGDLKRLRDKMVEQRSAGLDIEPAVQELRSISVELRKRNFVGTIVAYRRMKFAVDHQGAPGGEPAGPTEMADVLRGAPPA